MVDVPTLVFVFVFLQEKITLLKVMCGRVQSDAESPEPSEEFAARNVPKLED
jgi:hypothetical protein